MISVKKRITFSQCDPAGVLFFGEIFSIVHSVYEDFLNEIGLVEEIFLNKTFAFPIVSTSAKYCKPMKHNDEVVIDLSLKEIGKTSFQLHYQLLNSLFELSAEVDTVHVCVHKKTSKKHELTEAVKVALREL